MKKLTDMNRQEIKDRFDLWRSNIARDLKKQVVNPATPKDEKAKLQRDLENLYPTMSEANPFHYPDFVKSLENDGN